MPKRDKKQNIQENRRQELATNILEHLKKTAKGIKKWVLSSCLRLSLIMNLNINRAGRKIFPN